VFGMPGANVTGQMTFVEALVAVRTRDFLAKMVRHVLFH